MVKHDAVREAKGEGMREGNGGSRVRVACDVGGTFTDICVLNEATGRLHVAKVPRRQIPSMGSFRASPAPGLTSGTSRYSRTERHSQPTP